MHALLRIADRAGIELYVPKEIEGNCCGYVDEQNEAFSMSNKRTLRLSAHQVDE